ncbi:hypothetical protein [Nostoc sp. DedQUE09]|uniref:hypothetical protein n=1 Tax=Nostoc sp. DedQUE09 TaxID=3075394 RepID=UPI002AD368C8|nr:hypothetical protein [Nostoc sp. DedQUE09]MDZ7956281.1 hypothetical protein [Nostoc sp. DedQUE09]
MNNVWSSALVSALLYIDAKFVKSVTTVIFKCRILRCYLHIQQQKFLIFAEAIASPKIQNKLVLCKAYRDKTEKCDRFNSDFPVLNSGVE